MAQQLRRTEALQQHILFDDELSLERSLVRARWATAPMCLLLWLLDRNLSLVALGGVACGVAAANGVIAAVVKRDPARARLTRIRALATVIEWALGLGLLLAVANSDRDDPAVVCAVLFTLMLLSMVRYGLPGLAGALAAGVAAIIVSLVISGWPLSVTVLPVIGEWALVLTGVALILAGFGRGMTQLRSKSAREHAQYQQFRWQVSHREMDLLPWLARTDLTYGQIAGGLGVSPETVKTHVRRLGTKLRASGRQAVLHAARERGLLMDGGDLS